MSITCFEVNLLAFQEFSLPEFAFEVSHNACLKITTFLEKAAVMKNCKKLRKLGLTKAFVYQDLLASFCIHITIVFCLQMQTRIKYIKIDYKHTKRENSGGSLRFEKLS